MRRKDREITDSEKIKNILDSCKVCRIGLYDEGEIYIVPLNFGYFLDNDGRLTLYFHCAHEGRKIELLKKNSRVGFEMDCGHELVTADKACLYSYKYASLLGTGQAEFITDSEDKIQALRLMMKHQTGQDFDFTAEKANAITQFRIKVQKFSCKSHE